MQEIIDEIVERIIETHHARILTEDSSTKEIERFVSDLKHLSPQVLTNPVIMCLPDNSTRLYAEITVKDDPRGEYPWVQSALRDALVSNMLDLNIYIKVA